MTPQVIESPKYYAKLLEIRFITYPEQKIPIPYAIYLNIVGI